MGGYILTIVVGRQCRTNSDFFLWDNLYDTWRPSTDLYHTQCLSPNPDPTCVHLDPWGVQVPLNTRGSRFWTHVCSVPPGIWGPKKVNTRGSRFLRINTYFDMYFIRISTFLYVFYTYWPVAEMIDEFKEKVGTYMNCIRMCIYIYVLLILLVNTNIRAI